jgi:hypothetical protein
VNIAVPTAVRVEVGWDRTSASWTFVNRLRIADIPLDPGHANAAAGIRNRTRVSVADAHLGAAIRAADQVTVLTSDPLDMHVVARGQADRGRRLLARSSHFLLFALPSSHEL